MAESPVRDRGNKDVLIVSDYVLYQVDRELPNEQYNLVPSFFRIWAPRSEQLGLGMQVVAN